MHLDPEAIIVAEHPEDRKLIATCSGMRLGPSLGFMGLYMVHENHRNQGIGKRLWDRALKRLGNVNVGVRGDYRNFQNYKERYGFQFVTDYVIAYYECYENSIIKNIVRPKFGLSVATFFEGDLVSLQKIPTSKTNAGTCMYVDNTFPRNYTKSDVRKENSFEENSTILDPKVSVKNSLTDTSPTIQDKPSTELHNNSLITSNTTSKIKNEAHVSVSAIIRETSLNTHYVNSPETVPSSADMIINGVLDYDRRLHKRDRSSLVKQTLSWESCRCKVAIGSSGSVAGYGCLRPSVTSVWIVSPLYADSEDIARVLLQELLLDFDFRKATRGVQIRFPFQESRGEFLEKMGFSNTSIRISTGYTKECIDMETDKIFSFHSTVFCSE